MRENSPSSSPTTRADLPSPSSSTNRKIAALEAKLAAIKQSKPSAQDHGGEQWLDALVPDGEGMLGTGASTPTGGEGSGAEGSGSGDGKGKALEKRITVDHMKAGLPARPYFDAVGPPRET